MHRPHNLRLFSTLHLVYGILNLLLALFFACYAFFMGAFLTNIMNTGISSTTQDVPPFNPANLFFLIGSIGVVLCLVTTVLNLMTSQKLRKEKGYTFIVVTSVINCLSGMPGILLGIFTIIEINKPEVKALMKGEPQIENPPLDSSNF